LIEAAASAGLQQQISKIDSIANHEKAINAKIQGLSSQLATLNNSFNPSGGCS
jgi:hypothetical protein